MYGDSYQLSASGGGLTAPVALTDIADIAQATIIGRAAGAGTGDPTALTAAQVAAIEDAGRLVASTTVSGGAVATLQIAGLSSLTGRYRFEARIISSGAATSTAININGDTTTSNYRRGRFISSTGTPAEDSGNALCAIDGAGDFWILKAEFEVVGGLVSWTVTNIAESTTNRFLVGGGWHITATDIDSIEVVLNASVADDGSTAKLWSMP